MRIQDAWTFNSAVRRLATNSTIIDLLSQIYGRQAIPFQTLNFPVGTQQHFHSDMVHFSSSPERFMCGVWVAFEDTDADNGPLIYYPGSHRLPFLTNEQLGICARDLSSPPSQSLYHQYWEKLVETHDLKEIQFHAKKGQALIWLANLLHGGAPQRDRNRSRWSQVTHYYFSDCSYFTPMTSDVFMGKIAFRDIVSIVTGEKISNKYLGSCISEDFKRLTLPDRSNWHRPTPTA
jgi:ectoine hydroxylase-related dioxygenase (phytanoyl-CoA dioxygenase family)